MKFNFEEGSNFIDPASGDKLMPADQKLEKVGDGFWQDVISNVSEIAGTMKGQTLMDVRALMITKLFNIPQGHVSGIGVDRLNDEDRFIDLEFDRLMAEYFTNDTYIVEALNGVGEITTQDPREFGNIIEARERLEAFKRDVSDNVVNSQRKEIALDLYDILTKEFKLKERAQKLDQESFNCQLEIKYLSGGNVMILRGYKHNDDWHQKFGKDLAMIYGPIAKYVAIEGHGKQLGDNNPAWWSNDNDQQGHYDLLMKQLVDNGFEGHFLEIDMRDTSRVDLDSEISSEVYQEHLKYLQKHNPILSKQFQNNWQQLANAAIFRTNNPVFGDSDKLKKYHSAQTLKPRSQQISKTKQDLAWREKENNLAFVRGGTRYHSRGSIDKDFQTSSTPTGMELGSVVFTDALAALKHLMVSEAINKGVVDKGLIVDFEGVNHLSYKSFFLKYPQYAAEIVLRNLAELMKVDMTETERVLVMDDIVGTKEFDVVTDAEISKTYKHPNWKNILKEIGRIHMGHIEKSKLKQGTTTIGIHQRKYVSDPDLNLFDSIPFEVIEQFADDDFIQKQISSATK